MKPCRKCGSTERYPSGGCKPCGVEKNRELRKMRPDEVKVRRDKWRAKNASRIYELNRAWMLRTGWKQKPVGVKLPSARGQYKKLPISEQPCRKCGTINRLPSGACKPCQLIRARAYNAKNAARVEANRKRYLAENADKCRQQRQNRRARLAGAGVLSDGICERLHAIQCGRCACCGKPLGADYDLDHIMPLALDGLNVDANMQLLTARCNGRKLAKHPEQYAKERGFCYWPPRDWSSVTRTNAQIKSPAY